MIARIAGAAIQNLPSTIYWNSLRRFGVLRHDGTQAQIGGFRQLSRPLDDATEFVEHSDAVWGPSMPGPPENFFVLTSCDFALTLGEATWLAERISQAAPDTRLEFLVTKGTRCWDIAQFAWNDVEVNEATGQVRDAVNEARRFAVGTEPRCSTTCSSPNARRIFGFLSTRDDETISPIGLTSGAAKLKRAA